jgi:RNA polymerase sigma-70 factor, ECF subfamily
MGLGQVSLRSHATTKLGNFWFVGPEYVTGTTAGRPKCETIRPMRFEGGKEIELTDDGLLRRMSCGDEEAFTLLYRRKHPAIYRFALHMSANADTAEDVTQEVFMTLIRDPMRFDPARGTLTSFLFGVARNHLRKRWEQDRRLVGLPEGSDDSGYVGSVGQGGSNGSGLGRSATNGNAAHPEPVEHFASWEAVTRLRQAISTLPENYREVVALCELEEMSYEEAAAALDCPVGTVRSRLHRARALLVEKLRGGQPVRPAAVGE